MFTFHSWCGKIEKAQSFISFNHNHVHLPLYTQKTDMEAYLAPKEEVKKSVVETLFCNQTRFSAFICANETAPAVEILLQKPTFGGFLFCPKNLIEWWVWLVK